MTGVPDSNLLTKLPRGGSLILELKSCLRQKPKTDIAFHGHGLDHDLTWKENVASPLAVPTLQVPAAPAAPACRSHRPGLSRSFLSGRYSKWVALRWVSAGPQTAASLGDLFKHDFDRHHWGEREQRKAFSEDRGPGTGVSLVDSAGGLRPASVPTRVQSQGQRHAHAGDFSS